MAQTRRQRLALVAILLAAGCAGSGKSAPEAPPPRPPPDAQALERETVVTAAVVKLVLSERWRPKARVRGATGEVRTEDGATVVTWRGSVQLSLMELRVAATRELRITWLDREHDNILLHATEVVAFRQKETFQHSTEDLSAVTMANDVVRYWQQ